MGFRSGDFRFSYENDGTPMQYLGLGDGSDSHRTAAASIGIGEFSLNMKIFTGERSYKGDPERKKWTKQNFIDKYGAKHKWGGNTISNPYVNEVGAKHRLGALSIGYKGFNAGINSERVKHAFQGVGAHRWITHQGTFENTSWNVNSYFQYQSSNNFTIW